jgi:nucleotide-binding universal stress UspA family protein
MEVPMKNFSRVLVCTDFSPESLLAIQMATTFTKKTEGELFVLHVCELQVQWSWMVAELNLPEDQSFHEVHIMEKLNKKLRQVTDTYFREAKTYVVEGVPLSEIEKFIVEKNIDHVFIGKRGQGQHFFPMGSLTQKIISSSEVPVFVIKNEKPFKLIAGLVDPMGQAKQIIETTEELTYLYGCRGNIISVYKTVAGRFYGRPPIALSSPALDLNADEKEMIEGDIRQYFKKFLSPQTLISIMIEFTTEKKIAFYLNFLLQKNNIDFIILQRHEKSFFEKVFIGEEARRIIEIFPGNMLVLPP